jgi:hypothetical protein
MAHLFEGEVKELMLNGQPGDVAWMNGGYRVCTAIELDAVDIDSDCAEIMIAGTPTVGEICGILAA